LPRPRRGRLRMEDSKSGVVTVWVSDGQNAIISEV
jgi:hypothetical protein